MDFKKNGKLKNIQIQEHKLNTPQVPPQILDDSETYESSQRCKTDFSEKKSSTDYVIQNLKKNLGFFPKKNLYMEDIDSNFNLHSKKKRKYSLEEKLVIKNFVPQLKPIEIHLVPSKLCLNKKGFKDLKCNKDNKILLMSNNYFISCPNSEQEEEEEESDIDFSPEISNKNEDIKSTRKNLQKMKSGSLPKVLSRNLIEPNSKMYKEAIKIDYESDNEDSFDFKNDEDYLNNDNLLLYDDNDFIKYKIEEDEDKNKDNEKKEGEHNVRTNRINSCSILDVLKNRFSFDEPFLNNI